MTTSRALVQKCRAASGFCGLSAYRAPSVHQVLAKAGELGPHAGCAPLVLTERVIRITITVKRIGQIDTVGGLVAPEVQDLLVAG